MKHLKAINLCIGAALLTGAARAEEGMWMPQQIPQLAGKLTALGFKGDPKAFADLTGQPMGAIVSLGGCTASFVSPDGLIVTNHHCITGGLQFNSTPQRNLLKDGYLAKTRDAELPTAPAPASSSPPPSSTSPLPSRAPSRPPRKTANATT